MSATYPAGSTAEDYQRLADLGRALRPLIAPIDRLTWRAAAFRTEHELARELLDPAVLVRAAGGLPLLWLNVTYPVGTLPAGLLDAVIGEFDLRALGEFTEP
ncbi:hypothetical protein [Nocardia ignorata]|uniref:Uncharacterized protein n=1 Tax=Nocardia ignorata TaxID=145285 RepID=A0A4R6PWN4_NOCIG|nr:hypothetical protein [Nocardia ignorata]TDP42787.1 hypothetical protein DFR75_1011905 [Nocardia ignorata]